VQQPREPGGDDDLLLPSAGRTALPAGDPAAKLVANGKLEPALAAALQHVVELAQEVVSRLASLDPAAPLNPGSSVLQKRYGKTDPGVAAALISAAAGAEAGDRKSSGASGSSVAHS
jgi:hypothetical protein